MAYSSPYSAPTLTGYNSAPPSDDGATTAGNALRWSNHINKIGDPLKTYAQAVNSALTTAFTNLPAALNPETAAETAASVTPTNYEYEPGDVRRYGAALDGSADDTTALQNALDSNAAVFVPDGTLKITSKIDWDGTCLLLHGNGGYSSTILWAGSAGGTMLETNTNIRHQTAIKGIQFDGDATAGKAVHIKANAAARQLKFERCLFTDVNGNAVHLGNYSSDSNDADIANVAFNDCEWLDNNVGIYIDSTNAVGIELHGCFMSRISRNITYHIQCQRGGDFHVFGGLFGGYGSTGDEYAIYVKDGWGSVQGTAFEFGVSPNNGGALYLDTPVAGGLPDSRFFALRSCRILGLGDDNAANYIYIASSLHPLIVEGCAFQGKSTLTTYAINNTGGAAVISRGNYYVGRMWTTSDGMTISSDGDIFTDGTLVDVPTVLGRQVTITSADSPYTVTGETFIRSNSGSVTINLPSTVTHIHQGGGGNRSITILRTSAGGATTLTPAGGETINGSSSISMAAGAEHCITLMSNGSGNWEIVAWYVENPVVTASSGTGTVLMGNANNANSAGWLEIAPSRYVPYWSDPTP